MRPGLLFLVLVAVPSVAASPAVLYAHFDDAREDMALSVVPPPAGVVVDAELGLATHSTGCLPAAAGAGQFYHSWNAYPSLEPEGPDPDAPLRRGLGLDLHIDPDRPIVLHWYLSAPDVTAVGGPRPAVVPSVVVEASIRTGHALTIDPSDEDGDLVAHGRTGPHILAPGQPNHERIDGRDIYAFAVPLTLEMPDVPGETGFHINVATYMDVPGCDTPREAFMLDEMALHSSADHRPRLEWDVVGRVQVEGMATRPVSDHLILVFQPRGLFGLADVGNILVGLEGPDGHISVGLAGEGGKRPCDCYPPAPYYVFFAANMTDRTPGTYTWTVEVTDLAGEETAVGTVSYEHREQGVDTPAGFLAPVLLLAAVFWRRPFGAAARTMK